MKTLVFGDIHGRNIWNKFINQENPDKIIFIGDYFDSFNISGYKQKNNFQHILNFKRSRPDDVILLVGNHDFHYLDPNEKYSGYQYDNAFDIYELLRKSINEQLIQMCYIIDDIIFTHAGVSKVWCENNEIDLNDLENSINDRFYYKPSSFKFTMGANFSQYGDDVEQSPIWIRIPSLKKAKLENYRYVIGHTIQESINFDDGIIKIDTLPKQCLMIEDGTLSVCTLK